MHKPLARLSALADLPPPTGEVSHGAVQLWLWDQGPARSPVREDYVANSLSAAERLRADALTHPRRRRQFIRGRALVRHALSQMTDVPASRWEFAAGERGRPYIASPTLRMPLWFNLSHVDNVTVCAVTPHGPLIGVDVESLRNAAYALDSADEFFTPREQKALARQDRSDRSRKAVRLWALKESLSKAAEANLAETLGSATFLAEDPSNIRVAFTSPEYGPASSWAFSLYGHSESLVVALAVGGLPAGARPVNVFAQVCPTDTCGWI